MKKTIPFLFFAVLLPSLALFDAGCAFSVCAEKSVAPRTADRAFADNRFAAVSIRKVRIDDPTQILSYASGVFLGHGGLVLTNKHVALPPALKAGTYQFRVCLMFGPALAPCLPAEVVAVSSDSDDLALLRTELPFQPPFLIRPDSEPMNEAEEVYARLGFSDLLPPSLVRGRFAGIDLREDHALYDLPVMPGSSGGPVFDRQGRLVGLVDAYTLSEGRVLADVIPARTIRRFLVIHDLFL